MCVLILLLSIVVVVFVLFGFVVTFRERALSFKVTWLHISFGSIRLWSISVRDPPPPPLEIFCLLIGCFFMNRTAGFSWLQHTETFTIPSFPACIPLAHMRALVHVHAPCCILCEQFTYHGAHAWEHHSHTLLQDPLWRSVHALPPSLLRSLCTFSWALTPQLTDFSRSVNEYSVTRMCVLMAWGGDVLGQEEHCRKFPAAVQRQTATKTHHRYFHHWPVHHLCFSHPCIHPDVYSVPAFPNLEDQFFSFQCNLSFIYFYFYLIMTFSTHMHVFVMSRACQSGACHSQLLCWSQFSMSSFVCFWTVLPPTIFLL